MNMCLTIYKFVAIANVEIQPVKVFNWVKPEDIDANIITRHSSGLISISQL